MRAMTVGPSVLVPVGGCSAGGGMAERKQAAPRDPAVTDLPAVASAAAQRRRYGSAVLRIAGVMVLACIGCASGVEDGGESVDAAVNGSRDAAVDALGSFVDADPSAPDAEPSADAAASDLDPDLSLPDPGGATCTDVGYKATCGALEVCRFYDSSEGRCESCGSCGNLNAICTASADCDILFMCYQGRCTNFCTLGTSECGAPADCVDIGHPTRGVCRPF